MCLHIQTHLGVFERAAVQICTHKSYICSNIYYIFKFFNMALIYKLIINSKIKQYLMGFNFINSFNKIQIKEPLFLESQ